MNEVITDGRDGLLVNCYAPEEIAAAIHRLTGDARLRDELGKNARQTIIKNHTLERQITSFAVEYQTLVAEERSPVENRRRSSEP